MSSSNKLNGTDRLSKLFGNIVVANNNDVQSMNSVFGAIRRDREAAAAAAAVTQPAPKAAPVAEESRKDLGNAQDVNFAMSRVNGKILSQQRRHEKPITRSMDNDKFKPFNDEDAGKTPSAAHAPRKLLQEKVITRELFSSHLFEIKPTMGGKQLGMFATEPIPKNTEILREAPLILGGATWPGREAAYNMLQPSKRAIVDSLSSICYCGKKPELCLETPLMKLWAVNSFEMNPFLQAGDTANNNHIYDKACRINHACVPNCSRAFNSEHSVSIRAMRDIKQGQEITINYGVYGTATFRATNISERWKFVCTCNACMKKQFVPETGYAEYAHNKRLLCFERPQLIPLGAETPEEAALSEEIIEWADMIEDDILKAEAYWYAHTDELVSRGIARLRFTPEWKDLNESPTRNFLVSGHEKFLRENNKYDLSDKVIELYIWRATKALRAEVDRCHSMFMRKHS
ncbi:uncharacterized protein EAE97_006730 [Botrytis byssoidea]|uniref:SET domain-containing protein n=1 Tax=Botrytis byssoidea TaxID=139641 RepID=A0A9P5IKH9_9HELO|nr:uncharacterized protein EAE97_006730 [Botrytis byssoidea]KAF7941893.1 hypothetical protein EAE97_006730 [Botrytis byssoidea]